MKKYTVQGEKTTLYGQYAVLSVLKAVKSVLILRRLKYRVHDKKCVIELLTRLIFCDKSLKMTILTKRVSRKEYA